jgi:hypothetical protein
VKKIKIYLDTSVVSHLKADDTPEKMKDTLSFWEELKQGKYDIMVSDITIEELTECPEPKRSYLFEMMNQIEFIDVQETEDSVGLAKNYIKYGVLPEKSLDDCRHMAIATISECDFIVSWNFKHFVNIKTISKVQAVNKLLGYKEVLILPPSMILEGDEDYDK